MSETQRRELWIRLTTAVLLAAVFVSGAVVGGVAVRWIGEPQRHEPGKLGPPLSDLGLSREQEAKALEILERHRPQIEAIVNETIPKVRAINERVEQEIRAVLTPEQKLLLDEIKENRRPPPAPMIPPPHPGPPGGRRF